MRVSNCLFILTPGLEPREIRGTIKYLRSRNASSDRANLEIIVRPRGGMVLIEEREKSPAAKNPQRDQGHGFPLRKSAEKSGLIINKFIYIYNGSHRDSKMGMMRKKLL